MKDLAKSLSPCMKVIMAAHKAAKYSKYEMRKVASGKRARKWAQLNSTAIREYHRWIGEELKKLKEAKK